MLDVATASQDDGGTADGRRATIRPTAIAIGSTARANGGRVIESLGDTGFDLARLERAIDALVSDRDRLERALSTLRREVVAKDERIARLTSELDSATRTTAAACQRIDALVARLDHLDGVLAQADEAVRDPAERPASPQVGAQPS